MTACTNKARGAVVAALAGALALGAAPAVALAQGAEVSTLAQNAEGSLEGSKIVTATDGTDDIEVPEKGTITLAPGQYLVPTSIKPEFGDAIELDYTGSDANAALGYYKADSNGEATGGTLCNAETADDYDWVAGKYIVRVRIMDKDSAYYNKYVEFRFNVVGTNLDDAVIFNAADGNEDTTLDTFVWDFANQKIGVALDGIVLEEGTDYQIKFSKAGGSAQEASVTPNAAGSYVAYIYTVDWQYVKQVTFEIAPLDLSTADLQIGDMTYSEAQTAFGGTGIANVAANDVTLNNGSGVTITLNGGFVGTGKYTAHVKATADATNVRGEGDATFYVVQKVLGPDQFFYGNGALSAAPTSVDLSEGESFDLSKIYVTNGDNTTKLDSDLIDVWVTDVNGETVDSSRLQTAGTWKVNVRVNAEATEDWAYGSDVQTVTVKVVSGKVADDEYAFLYKGEPADTATGIKAAYDGTDVLEDIETVVRDGDKTLAEGTDYTVEVKDESGKVVDQIVDAGVYTLTIKSAGYTIDGTHSIKVTVSAMKPASVKVAVDVTDDKGNGYLGYTGEVLTPTYRFFDADGNELDVPADAFDVTYEKVVDADGKTVSVKDAELKEVGTYNAELETAKGVKNYNLDGLKVTGIIVTEKGVFLDIPANEWYSQAVYTAKKLGFMNGDGNGLTFSPSRSLTRAEAVCVLFNMAGGNSAYTADTIPGYDPNGEVYETGFSDVAGNEFYAKAIAWAKATGVANGYADGTFGVSRNVTSEEFACMLANYAKAMGKYEAVDADEALSSYSDASSVSDWARDSVAWAVSEGVMGNSAELAPSGDILRMRVAVMVTNYQDYKASSALIPVSGQTGTN